MWSCYNLHVPLSLSVVYAALQPSCGLPQSVSVSWPSAPPPASSWPEQLPHATGTYMYIHVRVNYIIGVEALFPTVLAIYMYTHRCTHTCTCSTLYLQLEWNGSCLPRIYMFIHVQNIHAYSMYIPHCAFLSFPFSHWLSIYATFVASWRSLHYLVPVINNIINLIHVHADLDVRNKAS